MKKSFLIVCAAAAAVFGCKNTFIGDYNTFLNQQTAAESEVPSVVENYFVELESDNGLLLKPSLPCCRSRAKCVQRRMFTPIKLK